MKKLILFIALAASQMMLQAEEIATMNIIVGNETKSIALSDLRKVTYSGDNMVVLLNDASSTSYAMSGISSIVLKNMPEKADDTAVEDIVNDTRNAARKVMIDGVIYIEKDGQRFSILGTRIL